MAAGQTLIVGGKDFIYFGGHLVPCIEPQCGLASCKILFFEGGERVILFFATKSRDNIFGYVK